MSKKDLFVSAFQQAGFLIAVLWGVFCLDMILPGSFTAWGIRPHEPLGWTGILFAPFLHGSTKHLIMNSMALFSLFLALSLFYREVMASTLVIIVFVCGIGIWLFGTPDSVHIGASGVVYGLAAFLILCGVWKRDVVLLALSVVVLVAYGFAMLQGLFVLTDGVSWSGHFFGAVGGTLAARVNRK